MKPEEELIQLRAENQALREQIEQRDHQLAHRDNLIAQLQQRLQAVEERLAKDSHKSHLPPSSDRFGRQPKSLRTKSGKKPGGQAGHPALRLVVREHHAEQKPCPECHQFTCASFPASVRAPLPYGERIGAMAIYLVQQHLVPLARATAVLEDLALHVDEPGNSVCLDRALRQTSAAH